MNQDQINALIREIVRAVAALIVTFNLLGSDAVSSLSALVIGVSMVVWAMLDSSSRPVFSLIRTMLQTIAPVLVSFSIINPEQGAVITAVLLSIVSAWTIQEKQ